VHVSDSVARASERRERVQHLRHEGKALREIAEETGVSHQMIAKDLLTFDNRLSNVSAPTGSVAPHSEDDALFGENAPPPTIAGARYNNDLMITQVDNYNSVTPSGYVMTRPEIAPL